MCAWSVSVIVTNRSKGEKELTRVAAAHSLLTMSVPEDEVRFLSTSENCLE